MCGRFENVSGSAVRFPACGTADVLKEQRDALGNEASTLRINLKNAQEEQALRMGQLREDHARELATAQNRISELEKLLVWAQARSFAAVD